MNKSEQINELALALSKAQSQMKAAPKMKTNPFFKSKYADLAAIWDCCREPLGNNGLSVVQMPEDNDKGFMLVTMLMHESGQWISSEYNVPVLKADQQALGSAITYAKRYALSAMIGIVSDEDDDGNAATKKSNVTSIKSVEYYDQAKFDKMKEKWRSAIDSGDKTTQDLIVYLTANAKLTEEQETEINSWGSQ